jgi:hypothetical protein
MVKSGELFGSAELAVQYGARVALIQAALAQHGGTLPRKVIAEEKRS